MFEMRILDLIKGFMQVFRAILLFIISFELAFASSVPQIMRAPAGSQSKEELLAEIDEIKKILEDNSLKSPCSKDDSALSSELGLSENLVQNQSSAVESKACLVEIFQSSGHANQSASNPCKATTVPGLISKAKVLADAHDLPEGSAQDPKIILNSINSIQSRSFSLKESVELFLESSAENAEKQELIFTYHESLLADFAKLEILKARIDKNPIKKENINRYLLKFSSDIFSEDLTDPIISLRDEVTPEGRLVTVYKIGGANPLLKTSVDSNGYVSLSINFFPMMASLFPELVNSHSKEGIVKLLKLMTSNLMLDLIKRYDFFLDETLNSQNGQRKTYSLPQSCFDEGDIFRQMDIFKEQNAESEKYISQFYLKEYLAKMGLAQFDLGLYNPNFSIETDETILGTNPLEYFPKPSHFFQDFYSSFLVQERSNLNVFFQPWLTDNHFLIHQKTSWPEVMGVYLDKANSFQGRSQKSSIAADGENSQKIPRIYKDIEVLESIFKFPNDPMALDFNRDSDSAFNNINEYLSNKLNENNLEIDEVLSLVPDKDVKELKARNITVPFPSFHSGPMYRQWAVSMLAEYARNHTDVPAVSNKKKVPAYFALESVCHSARFKNKLPKICSDESLRKGTSYDELFKKLTSYDSTLLKFIPATDLKEMDEVFYIFLGELWGHLQEEDKEFYTLTETTAYTYLENQISFYNPWAFVHLSYLIHRDELKQSVSKMPAPKMVQTQRGLRVVPSSFLQCPVADPKGELKRFETASKILKIDSILIPFDIEKRSNASYKKEVWKNVYDNYAEKERGMFNITLGGMSVFDIIDRLSRISFLNREKAMKVINALPISLPKNDLKALDEAYDTLAPQITFYNDLWNVRGDENKVQDLLTRFQDQYGISEIAYQENREDMWKTQNLLQGIAIESVAKMAIRERRAKAYGQLEQLCGLDSNNQRELKKLFAITGKAQAELNPKVRNSKAFKEIIDRVEEMDDEEFVNTMIALGSGVLAMAAAVLTSIATGGAGIPMAIAILSTGLGSIALQTYEAPREFIRITETKDNAAYIKDLERLGIAERNSSQLMEESYFFSGLEFLAILPLVGIAARSTQIGSKAVVQLGKGISRNTLEYGYKEAYRMAKSSVRASVEDTHIYEAENILGMRKVFNEAASRIRHVMGTESLSEDELLLREIDVYFSQNRLSRENFELIQARNEQLKLKLAEGSLNPSQYIREIKKTIDELGHLKKVNGKSAYIFTPSPILTKTGPEAIDAYTVRTVMTRLNGNPSVMRSELKYLSKKLSKVPNVNQYNHRYIVKFEEFLKKFRYGHLQDVEKEIESLLVKINDVKTPAQLETFLKDNIDDLTKIYHNLPMRKREFPYMALFQGGPFTGGLFGRRTPGLSRATDGQILRKIFSARDVLMNRYYDERMEDVLKVGKHLMTYDAKSAIDALVEGSWEYLKKLPNDKLQNELVRLDKIYASLFNQVKDRAKEVLNEDTYKGLRKTFGRKNVPANLLGRSDEEYLYRLIFRPQGGIEEALSKRIWTRINASDALDIKELGNYALVAKKRLLNNYETLGELEQLYKAFQILNMRKAVGIVEVL